MLKLETTCQETLQIYFTLTGLFSEMLLNTDRFVFVLLSKLTLFERIVVLDVPKRAALLINIVF